MYVYKTEKDTPTANWEFGTYKFDDKGEQVKMCNFVAGVTEQVTYVDGREQRTVFRIDGETFNGPLQTAEIPADKFSSLGWILEAWGVEAVVLPGHAIKDALRAAIQTRAVPQKRTVFLATGWQQIEGVPHFLHAGGAIGPKGNNSQVELALPHELKRYNLTTKLDPAEGLKASLELTQIVEDPNAYEIGWVMLAATYAPTLGPVDFAAHVTGKTGTFKSELCSLFQSHYGQMDARSLPGSWSSTGNALEALAYIARNASFTIDDYVPRGTKWQQKALEANADQVIRGQGNQQGRQRLTDTSAMQETKYPRGIVISTGEDTPEGHSLRGRTAIMELSPGSIKPPTLSRAQANRPLYVAAMAGWLQWLCHHRKEAQQAMKDAKAHRDVLLEIGHSRTPDMLGRLIATAQLLIDYAADIGVVAKRDKQKWKSQAESAIITMGKKQSQYLEESDPIEMFFAAIRGMLSGGQGYFRTQDGGIPKRAEILGWEPQGGDSSGMTTYKPRGKRMGWINWDEDEMYLEIQTIYGDIKRASQGNINLSQITLLKRLKESNHLARTDSRGNRNVVRVKAEGATRTVVVLGLGSTLETSEVPE